MELENKLEDLKKSPMFNLSLSSKELFHSNFLAWVMEAYPKKMASCFSELFNIDASDPQCIQNVQREKSNIDLSFTIGDTLCLIENKVKSIAYKDQLDKYSQYIISDFIKNDNQGITKIKHILLSPLIPGFFNLNDKYEPSKSDIVKHLKKEQRKKRENKIKDIIWHYVSYEEMLKSLADFKLKQIYNEEIINDYVVFMTLLLELILGKKDVDIIKLYKKDSAENKFLEKTQDLRLHDFYQKVVFSSFAELVEKELNNNGEKCEFGVKVSGKDPQIEGIYMNWGFTNSTGFLDVKYISKKFHIVIQIQGNQYRKMIVGKDNKGVIEAAGKYSDLFKFDTGIAVYPEKVNRFFEENDSMDDKKFNRYNTTKYLAMYKYVYTSDLKEVDIDSNLSLAKKISLDLINMIEVVK